MELLDELVLLVQLDVELMVAFLSGLVDVLVVLVVLAFSN
jgi:hypothetical protein